MKFIIITIIFTALFLFLAKPRNLEAPQARHFNNGAYEIELLPDSIVDDSAAELVSLESSDGRIRINSGCYDFGTEGLSASAETTILAGEPALKESFFANSKLKMERFSVNHDGQCYALELYANKEAEWAKLEEVVRTFRFVR